MWPAHFTDAITDALESGFVRSGLHSIQMTLHMLWKVVSCGLHSIQMLLQMPWSAVACGLHSIQMLLQMLCKTVVGRTVYRGYYRCFGKRFRVACTVHRYHYRCFSHEAH